MQFRPCYNFTGASPLLLDMAYLFLVGFNILLLMAVQQPVVIWVLSQGKMSTHPSSPSSWAQVLGVSTNAFLPANDFFHHGREVPTRASGLSQVTSPTGPLVQQKGLPQCLPTQTGSTCLGSNGTSVF